MATNALEIDKKRYSDKLLLAQITSNYSTNNKCGFYTTRWVESTDPENAELKAVDLIRNDPDLKGAVLNERSDPPMIYLEQIHEIDTFDDVNPPGTGYSFYIEDKE